MTCGNSITAKTITAETPSRIVLSRLRRWYIFPAGITFCSRGPWKPRPSLPGSCPDALSRNHRTCSGQRTMPDASRPRLICSAHWLAVRTPWSKASSLTLVLRFGVLFVDGQRRQKPDLAERIWLERVLLPGTRCPRLCALPGREATLLRTHRSGSWR